MIVTIVRTAFFYLIVILCMRLMGKRQVGELQPSELVVTILISELASIPMQDLNRPVSNGLIAIFVLVILELILSALSLKFPPIRRLFAGKAAIVIANGEIDQKMMKRLRYSIDDLLEGLREDGCFCIEDVQYALLETDGKLSVMMKKSAEPPTRQEMNIEHSEPGLPATIISDGKLQKGAFNSGEITIDSVKTALDEQKLSVGDVFLMTGDKSGEFTIIRKDKSI